MKKDYFCIPPDVLYLCGHSLGPMLVHARDIIERTLNDWQQYGANSWDCAGWYELGHRVGNRIAHLLGANDHEVIVSDCTVINLYKLLLSALNFKKTRNVVLTTKDNFPADCYIVQGIRQFFPNIILKSVSTAEIPEHLNDNVAVLMLTQVDYRNASLLDMNSLTKMAKEKGILTLWDLSHSIGMVPLDLKESAIDLAVGCTYKYLSGGPGSPAFLYINSELCKKIKSPILGWFGHKKPFDFSAEFSAKGINQFKSGTPPLLSLKGLEAAVQFFDPNLVQQVYTLSLEYSRLLIEDLKTMPVTVATPLSPRGGHVAFFYSQALQLFRALTKRKIICDYRHPGLIRVCVNPLYLSLEDLKYFLKIVREIVADKSCFTQKIMGNLS